MKEVTKRYIHTMGESWYVVYHNGEDEGPNYCWAWVESGEAPDYGPDFHTIQEALLDAALDWEVCGSGTSLMARRLRLAATQYGKTRANTTRKARY